MSNFIYPGWKLELKADAKPGKTGDDDGTPSAAPAACSGATDATEAGAAPDSPMNEGSTGLLVPPDTPSPGKAVGLAPGGRPWNIDGAEARPRPKGEAAAGVALGVKLGYLEVGGWLGMLVVGDIVGPDEVVVAEGREQVRAGKGERPG